MKTSIHNLIRNALISPALLLSLAATQPLHAFAQPAPAPASDIDATYVAGTRAMNQQQWTSAVADFDVIINAKSKRSDSALYWKAYSLNKLGNKGLALTTCFQLRSQFKDSSWNKDCSALSIDLNPNNPAINIDAQAISDSVKASLEAQGLEGPERPEKPERPERPEFKGDPNEDIKILALNSLLNQDPDRALPILRNILAGNQSPAMKRQALFILTQSRSPEAQSILHDAATGKLDPSLQRQAIESMAIFKGKSANDTFAEIYRTTNDPQVKRAVISALFITHDADRLVELARNEKDLELKRDIVSKLALMHDKVATDYMLELLK